MTATFRLEHEFPSVSLEKFIAHLNDPKLNQMLESELGFDERRLIDRSESPDEIEWQFTVRKIGDLPSAVKKIFKGDALSWTEVSRLVKSENCIYWTIDPDSSMLKFHGEGVWLLKAAGDGCKRIIEGKINVDIPFVGKVVETFIVNELKKTYEIEPDIQTRFYSQV